MQWRNLYRGFFIGISDLIPGVRGVATASVLGIYDEILVAIKGFFSRDWKKYIGFLLPLGIGFVVTLLLFSKGIAFLLKNYYDPIHYFFIGLIIGVLPFIAKQAGVKRNFKLPHFLLIIVVGGVLAIIAITNPYEMTTIKTLTGANIVGLFFAGWAGGMAMLLPGIGGSLIFLLLGVYSTAIGALAKLNFPIILVIGAGVVAGFFIGNKAIRYLLSRYKILTFTISIGLVIGTVFIVYPGIPESGTPFVTSVIAFITGLIVANVFSSSTQTSGEHN